jgi:hypothetical protein
MSTAGEVAKQNEDKAWLAKELEDISLEIKGLERKRDYMKSRLEPMMVVGERLGLVEKTRAEYLLVDATLLEVLEKQFGEEVVKREVNTKFLRERMAENPELDRRIPRQERVQLRVGEPYRK